MMRIPPKLSGLFPWLKGTKLGDAGLIEPDKDLTPPADSDMVDGERSE